MKELDKWCHSKRKKENSTKSLSKHWLEDSPKKRKNYTPPKANIKIDGCVKGFPSSTKAFVGDVSAEYPNGLGEGELAS